MMNDISNYLQRVNDPSRLVVFEDFMINMVCKISGKVDKVIYSNW